MDVSEPDHICMYIIAKISLAGKINSQGTSNALAGCGKNSASYQGIALAMP
jgi:hypothetical protein